MRITAGPQFPNHRIRRGSIGLLLIGSTDEIERANVGAGEAVEELALRGWKAQIPTVSI
jgi:hypothetical protein